MRYTVPWLPISMPQPEFPGELVRLMQSVKNVVTKHPGRHALDIIESMHATNPYGYEWEQCERVVELAIELGMVEGMMRYEGVA